MFFHHHKKTWPWIVLAGVSVFIFCAWLAAVYVSRHWFEVLPVEKIIESQTVRDTVVKKFGDDGEKIFDWLPAILGFSEPQNYLFLLQNNTEMRPGGGFIGTYAVLRADRGKFSLIAFDGTENLDRAAPKDWIVKPPTPISEHLGVDRWYFRDSNWSPDFPENAKKAMEFYQAEGGVDGENINSVIAITPTALEEILRLTGPIKVNGITFSSEDVTKELEYEVEYGYWEKGISFVERKKIIKNFFFALFGKVERDVFTRSEEYFNSIKKLADERHLMFFSKSEAFKNLYESKGWGGELLSNDGDFLLWADANLAALKTDASIKRNLKYEIFKRDGKYAARATMAYVHQGVFDWRTSRYRTYARIFVPLGSKLIATKGSMKWDRSTEEGKIDSGIELEKTWFGAFISIEPGKTKSLSFEYFLPTELDKKIKAGEYNLLWQKQSGLPEIGLTLNLDFDKSIVFASPAEEKKNWGDDVYDISLIRRADSRFTIRYVD